MLPLATAYSVSEAFGFRKGVNLDFRRAPIFVGLFTALVLVGALVALIPGVPVVQLLVGVQVLNGMLLPIILVFVLILANDRRLTGALRNGRVSSVLGWGTFVLVTGAVGVLLGSQLLELARHHDPGRLVDQYDPCHLQPGVDHLERWTPPRRPRRCANPRR